MCGNYQKGKKANVHFGEVKKNPFALTFIQAWNEKLKTKIRRVHSHSE